MRNLLPLVYSVVRYSVNCAYRSGFVHVRSSSSSHGFSLQSLKIRLTLPCCFSHESDCPWLSIVLVMR